jgi:hypothetical protein
MKSSIVIELQKLATDENESITKLLKQALIVATKLNLLDFQIWINKELDGYNNVKEVPKYRHVMGEIKAWNPYNRIWIPLIWRDFPKGGLERSITQPISEIEYIFKKQDNNKKNFLTIPFSSEQQAILIEHFDPPSPPVLIIPRSSMSKILDAVRNIILRWSLKLEAEGILGEKMSFTEDEKGKAQYNQKIKIDNFYGIIGNVFEETITQEINISVKSNDLDSLLKYLKSKGINSEDLENLKEAIRKDPKPKQKDKLGKNVSKRFSKIMEKASSGAWNVGIGLATNILTNALFKYYGLI